ncbi:hypothetical protein SmJEL517_g01429 [Synchytrium microbalum]|uniref:GH26 domain-containing protein n=1 Tax=Synchytrium microbalum TaxID=1806994 RepID=A0A507CAT2_9FUNG|nr:uncharacterized protein SmJEL517_g01429 [Synchytrium microbalum]TPX36289.1 hypothetical protein SmJEL517_g01429 [Synchytrium microbalum]
MFEPPAGSMWLSVWLDHYREHTFNTSRVVSERFSEVLTSRFATAWQGTFHVDTPQALYSRTGRQWGALSMSQNIPVFSELTNDPGVNDTMDYSLVDAVNSDALLLISIYPYTFPAGTSWTAILDSDIQALVDQCASYNKKGRRVILRFAPEMNGNWYPWALQPTAFIATFRKLALLIQAQAPLTAMLWSPMVSENGGYVPTSSTGTMSAADLALLDTNKNGVVDSGDNPYTPFWPGTDVVDWVGASMYDFGPYDNSLSTYVTNSLPPSNFFEARLTGGLVNFYDYVVSLGKPLSITELGKPFYLDYFANGYNGAATPIDAGPGNLAMKQAFWSQAITNKTMLDKYPNIKFIGLFEFRKYELETLRDFQFLNDTTNGGTVMKAFLADIDASGVNIIWANSTNGTTTAPPTATTTKSILTVTQAPSSSFSERQAELNAFGFLVSVCVIVIAGLF